MNSTSEIVSSSLPVSSTVLFEDLPLSIEVPPPDYSAIISSLDTGFIAVVVGVGFIAGLIISKIANWWKW